MKALYVTGRLASMTPSEHRINEVHDYFVWHGERCVSFTTEPHNGVHLYAALWPLADLYYQSGGRQ